MAGLVGYKGTLSLYSYTVAELTDLSVDGTREDHDVSDLGDAIVQHAGGRLNLILTGNANFLSFANSCLHARLRSQVETNINATGAISVDDPKGSCVFSGNGVWLDAGLTMPAGPMVQPFRFALNDWT